MKKSKFLLLFLILIILPNFLTSGENDQEEPMIAIPKIMWGEILERGNFTQNEFLKLRSVNKDFCSLVENTFTTGKKSLSIKTHLASLNKENSLNLKKIFPCVTDLTLVLKDKGDEYQKYLASYVNFKKFPNVKKITLQLLGHMCLFASFLPAFDERFEENKCCWHSTDEILQMMNNWRTAISFLTLIFPDKVSIHLFKKACTSDDLIEENLEVEKIVIKYLNSMGMVQKKVTSAGDISFQINEQYSPQQLNINYGNFILDFLRSAESE